MEFPTGYEEILQRIRSVDPLQYAETRNYLNGAVTRLSPYISRGVISLRKVAEMILSAGYHKDEADKLIQELAWREYFQRTWQYLEDDIFDDIRNRYTGIRHARIPAALLRAETGIEAIDHAIRQLYETGYMHNHLRMYLASICCSTAKAHWLNPSRWMYYYLLDGDLASNSCSWQWVAGSFSSGPYTCNQENINRYTGSRQRGTYLDLPYDALPLTDIPPSLTETATFNEMSPLPEKKFPVLDPALPLLIYNSYNLDPLWRSGIQANRVLLLEPSHFRQFPVSGKVIQFILSLAKNIEGIQVFTGELQELTALNRFPVVISKEHPAFVHYPGIKDEREWLFPGISGLYPSFFSYWKKCRKELEAFVPLRATGIRA